MLEQIQKDIGTGSLFSGQYNTFDCLFQGGYYYCVSIFPEPMSELTDKNKVREEFHIIIYNPSNGQQLADDSGNGVPLCRMLISEGEPLNLKIVVSRDTQTNNNSNDPVLYKVTLFGYDSEKYDRLYNSAETIPLPEIYWLDF